MSIHTRTLATGLAFPEAPRWHEGKLWISDMFARRVVTIDQGGSIEEIVHVPGRPSGLGWLPDGRLIIVSMDDHRLLVLHDDKLETYTDLGFLCGGPANDMVVDSLGRAYVGNFGINYPAEIVPRSANLILVDHGTPRVVADKLRFPNGTVISPDGRTLIIAESDAYRLTAFDINPEDGSLLNRRLFADLGSGSPDGICLDAEGAVWVASYNKNEFIRVSERGETTHRVSTDDRCAIACMLGGEFRTELYMSSAKVTENDFFNGIAEGRVDVATVDTPGVGIP